MKRTRNSSVIKTAIAFLIAHQIACQPTAEAEALIGYENAGIQSLTFCVQTHSLITDGTKVITTSPATGNPIPGDTMSRTEVLIDVSGKRTLELVRAKQDSPAFTRMHDAKNVMIDNINTMVNYVKGVVTIQKFNPYGVDSTSAIYAGRAHGGKVLADVIENAQKTNTINASENGWTLEFKAASFTPPNQSKTIHLELNKEFRVIRLVDENRTFTFEWKKKEPEDFWYVQHTLMKTEPLGRFAFSIEQWVHEIAIDAKIPDRAFDASYPKDYEVHDFTIPIITPSISK